MTKAGDRPRWPFKRLLIGAIAVVSVSGCSSGPTRPPMPDMSKLVPINDRVPTELQDSYIVDRYDTKPLALSLSHDQFSFGLPVLPYVDVDAALAAVEPLRQTSVPAIEYGPRLAMYDALDATVAPVSAVVVTPAPSFQPVESSPRTLTANISAEPHETVTPLDTGDSSGWREGWLSAGDTTVPAVTADSEGNEPLTSALLADSAPQRVDASASVLLASILEPVSATPAPVVQPTWTVVRGPFRAQALSWGEQDPTWEVHWLADQNPIISVDRYEFVGPLDEVLIQAVSSLAAAGAPIRIERARANHQLIIRSKD